MCSGWSSRWSRWSFSILRCKWSKHLSRRSCICSCSVVEQGGGGQSPDLDVAASLNCPNQCFISSSYFLCTWAFVSCDEEDSSWFCGIQSRSCWHHHHISPFAGNLGACVKVSKLFRAQHSWTSENDPALIWCWRNEKLGPKPKLDNSQRRSEQVFANGHHHYIIVIIMIAIVEGQLTKKIIRRTGLANQQRELGLTQHLHKSNGSVAASVRKNEMPNS